MQRIWRTWQTNLRHSDAMSISNVQMGLAVKTHDERQRGASAAFGALSLCVTIFGCGGADKAPAKGVGATSAHVYIELPNSSNSYFPRGDAAALGLDVPAIDALIDEAAATHSDALLLLKDGRVVVERYFGHRPRPTALMSVTKGLVSLAVGALLDEGKIASVDSPVSTWFPEWGEGLKAKVTLRHVLTHTSGLEHPGPATLYKQADRLAYARQLPVIEEPGKHVSYNNEAVELLSGIVRLAAGKPLDAYMREKIFEPMGIVEASWDKDSAGNVQTFADLKMFPRDLAKIGQMMLDGGQWNGKPTCSCVSRSRGLFGRPRRAA